MLSWCASKILYKVKCKIRVYKKVDNYFVCKFFIGHNMRFDFF